MVKVNNFSKKIYFFRAAKVTQKKEFRETRNIFYLSFFRHRRL